MNIQNSEIAKLYKKEDGKLILELEETRYQQYINIIETNPQYKAIIDNIPSDFSNLEKAYYVYNKLGKLLYENNSLVYNHLENMDMYYGLIRDFGVGNCRQMSELYVSMLKYKEIIEGYYLIRKPVGVEKIDLRHIDAIILINGNKYMVDIIRDTVNIRAGIRNMKFGFKDSKNDRVESLKQKIMSIETISQAVKEHLLKCIEMNQFEELLKLILAYEKETGLSIESKYFENKIPKIEYIEQVEKQIGEIQQIPIKSNGSGISIEELDTKTNNINHFENMKFPFNLNLSQYRYLEDIIKYELVPKLIVPNSPIRIAWSLSNNLLTSDTINENLELDTAIIIDFLSKASPNLDQELYIKFIRQIIGEIYSERYGIKYIDFKSWTKNNIRLYKTALDSDNKKELNLKTFLVIRKFKGTSLTEKYIFYEFQNDENKFIRQTYGDVISNLRIKKVKVCSKFSSTRKDFAEELEL